MSEGSNGRNGGAKAAVKFAAQPSDRICELLWSMRGIQLSRTDFSTLLARKIEREFSERKLRVPEGAELSWHTFNDVRMAIEALLGA
jgi:hypothetical protein